MKKFSIFIIVMVFFSGASVFAQFGKNKVQYKDFTWYYIQTDHFDIYFTDNGGDLAEFTSKIAEQSLKSIQKSFNYRINNRIAIIIYNSTNDFQETNITDQYLTEGIEGFTELFKNRVVIQFMGSYKQFEHLIHHELTHAVINDMFYGGSIQNIISNNISVNLPLWFNEGMAEYQALGWDINSDMFIRDAAINEYLPNISQLNGYFAYRGGEAVFHYIDKKYGKEKIGQLVNKIKSTGNVNDALKETIGISLKELNERWKKDIKKTFWPDIAIRKDPDEFAKRLTDPEKDGGFYNTSPAISPQGDKIAFISNRDYYFDVYLMDALDGKIIKRLVKGNRTPDFEELNVITPGLTWSPDGKKIALSAKSNGLDVIYIIDVESEDKITLPVSLEGISSVTWSHKGDNLTFVGHNAKQSDIYVYNIDTKVLQNLTDDIFSDKDPVWSNDDKTIYFASDRGNDIYENRLNKNFKIYNHDYSQDDLYAVNVGNKTIERITNTPNSSESSPAVGPEGKEILFISDLNGITNIYKKRVVLEKDDTVSTVDDLEAIPITNSLNGLYQLSLSRDGKKLTFSTFYKGSFNIFLLNNPFQINLDEKKLPLTKYVAGLRNKEKEKTEGKIVEREFEEDTADRGNLNIVTGSIVDTSKIYGDTVKIDFNNYVFGSEDKKLKPDSTLADNEQFKLTDNLDKHGDFRVNRYKITFSPDIVYANAGYSSLYGLLGTTIVSFSDVLGNHRLVGVTGLQIDLKNSDYGLAYYYLPRRINYGIEAFHTARFVYLSRGFGYNLYRFRNFGAVLSMGYPLNKFYRIDMGLSWLNLSKENLDNTSEPLEKASLVVPSVSFIHDNVLWGSTAPIDGTRYRFDLLGNPMFKSKLSFYSAVGDYRTYFKLGDEYSFVFRLSGGYSGGKNPQKFFIGGTDNWINRKFATTDIPLESATDFVFLTAAVPLRGFDYAQEIGSKYGLMNLELRFPLIRYLLTGGLPLFFNNIMGVAFIDMGTAWDKNKNLRFFKRNENGNVVTDDLLMGTGVGARLFFLYFLVRFDVAWAYNYNSFSKAKFYVSLGADF